METVSKNRLKRALRFLSTHRPELAVFLLGVVLRLSMSWNFHPLWSYDTDFHWAVVTWVAEHREIPAPETLFEAFHPPLYYVLAAALTKLGVNRAGMAWLSIVPSILELAVIWAGLELYVTRSRVARVSALALAAVTSALIHLGGMVYPESLNCFLNAVILLVVPLVFRRQGADRWLPAMLVGVLFGLAMLTKISGAATILAVGVGVLLEFAFSRRPFARRASNALAWLASIVVCVAVSGWYFGRNVREYGTPFVTSFTLPSQEWLVATAEQKPLVDRRPLGFLFGWDRSLYVHPFRLPETGTHERLFPVAIASTFIDFWGYGYAGFDHPYARRRGGMREQYETLGIARGAMAGGTVVFFAAALAWVAAARRTLRFRDFGRLTVILAPLSMLVATIQFATAYPVDLYGVVKGIYMSFGAPPLYAAFGIATGWAARSPRRLPVLVLLMASLVAIAIYSIDCRLLPL
jgi:hypothetical protein